jgi:trk system potassium uptake protein TrkA
MSMKQALVVGLGQFGMSVARALSGRRVEVFAVDVREERVRTASTFATAAASFDATDEDALARTLPQNRDVCLCAIGDEAKEASIICTALLTQLGAKRVIARSNDDLHARILTLVGAHQVVNPERAFGDRFANQIVHERIRGELELGEGIFITDLVTPEVFVGRPLSELRLPNRYGVTVVAIRKHSTGAIVMPGPNITIDSEDVLVVVAKEQAVQRMIEGTS